METSSQKRTLTRYRTRLTERGLARFEVLGRRSDRTLLRAIARRLAEDGPGAAALRETMTDAVAEKASRKGGILEALRRSPLVGADLDFSRLRVADRDIDL